MAESGKGGFQRNEKVIILLKVFSIILVFITISTFIILSDKKSTAEQGSSYVVMYAGSGQVLAGKNLDMPLPMASTTKIMTALVTLKKCALSEVVIIPKQAVGIEGSSVYLREGEHFTVEQLLYALMLRSGNDSAVALALHVGKNMDDFVEMMNEEARSLGLKNTHFTNPHGLHDPDHFTSARDLGLIACRAMSDPVFKKIVSTKRFDVPASDHTAQRVWYNKNKLLTSFEGANGIKTGYTTKSGRCLVAAAEREGNDLQPLLVRLRKIFFPRKQDDAHCLPLFFRIGFGIDLQKIFLFRSVTFVFHKSTVCRFVHGFDQIAKICRPSSLLQTKHIFRIFPLPQGSVCKPERGKPLFFRLRAERADDLLVYLFLLDNAVFVLSLSAAFKLRLDEHKRFAPFGKNVRNDGENIC